MMRKTIIKIGAHEEKENIRNREVLKVLQPRGDQREILAGRPFIDKDFKLAASVDTHEAKRKKLEDKSVQTENNSVAAEDLTAEEASPEYWQTLAQQYEEKLDESLHENERLKETNEALEEENKTCKQMLEESRALVELLQEMLNDEAEASESDKTETTKEAGKTETTKESSDETS